jgi:serine phosphatase RsbU (regulator of sigma subunit)
MIDFHAYQHESPALRRAALRSEVARGSALLVMLLVLAAVAGYFVVHPVEASRAEEVAGLVLVLAFMVYELIWMRTTLRSLRGEREPATWARTLSVVVEGLIPAVFLAVQLRSTGDVTGAVQNPFAVLLGPGLAFAYVLMLLSVLRLDPALSLIGGVTAVVSYAGVCGYVFATRPYLEVGAPFVHWTTFPIMGVILTLGVASAWLVAAEVRKHVEAAVKEEEIKRNIERIERDLQVARDIQQGLLPATLPDISGYEIAAYCKPADQTGGDYYDCIPLVGTARTLFTIADVTGHGVGPALVTAAARAYVRSSAHATVTPAEILHRANANLYQDIAPDRFVTLAVLDLDAASHSATLLSAGQGPMLRVRRDGASTSVDAINAHAPPLAVIEELPLGAGFTFTLERGESVILMSDGVFEWKNVSGELFGVDRVKHLLSQHADKPATAQLALVQSAVKAFAGDSQQTDDVTIVVVRRA